VEVKISGKGASWKCQDNNGGGPHLTYGGRVITKVICRVQNYSVGQYVASTVPSSPWPFLKPLKYLK